MLNKERLDNLTDQIWKSAVKLRGNFKAYEYQNVVLPMIVIRRLECVLIKERERIAKGIKAKQPSITDEALAKMVKSLEPSMLSFYNKTDWTLRKIIEEDTTKIEAHFREYLNGFSDNIQEIIDKFNYRSTIGQMVTKGQLDSIIRQYSIEQLGPDNLSNLEMGYVYEELIRKFSEQSGEEAGEHFTPREVIRLMVELLEIKVGQQRISIYDPACGTGGMLSVAKEHMLDKAANDKERERMDNLVTLYGQELQQSNYAICKADMLIKGDKNTHINWGNSLVPEQHGERIPGDQHANETFDYMLSNPPFGVSWSEYKSRVEKYQTTRYKAGLPPSNNGAFLFLQTMLEKMKPADKGGSKIAIIFNGSPLSNGDCLGGESEIRRWIMDNDWLDTIVMLPDQLFYNTGIFTYIWLLSNVKPATRKDKILLIDARNQFEKEPKSFGSKRNRQVDEHRAWIEERYRNWQEGEQCKIFKTKDFAYHKVKVVFWQTDENDHQAYITEPFDKTLTNANVKKDQDLYGNLDFALSVTFPNGTAEKIELTLKPENQFVTVFENTLFKAHPKKFAGLTGRELKTFIRGLRVEAEYTHRQYVVDWEYIPYGENIEAFLTREIGKQIISWEDSAQLGYEVLPNKYFYKFLEPEQARGILDRFWSLESEAETILKKLEEFQDSVVYSSINKGIDLAVEMIDSKVEWIGKYPKHWKREKLKRLLKCPLQYGANEAAELDDVSLPRYIRITDFGNDGTIRPDTFKSLPSEKANGYYLNNGDILFARSGATVGKTFQFKNYDGVACFAGYLIRAVPDENIILSDYLYLYTKSPLYEAWKNFIFTQATIQNIGADKYDYLDVLVPPIEEQKEIIKYIHDGLAKIDAIETKISSQMDSLQQYKKSLIYECVTGKKRISGEVA